MSKAPARWTLAYYGGWMAALAGLLAVLAQCVVVSASEPQSPAIEGWSLGVILGVMFGMFAAYATRNSHATHRALGWLGRFLCVVGLCMAAVLFLLSDNARREPNVFLGGLVEFLFALLALLLAAVGGCAWLAGVSGRHIAQPVASGDGAPLQ